MDTLALAIDRRAGGCGQEREMERLHAKIGQLIVGRDLYEVVRKMSALETLSFLTATAYLAESGGARRNRTDDLFMPLKRHPLTGHNKMK